jgi:signal transduction histidine kinase
VTRAAVIGKTIVYGSLAAFITTVYVAIVAGIGSLGSSSAGGSGSRPNLALSILATAVVAVAFQPVRERMQHLANRLVYGKRATPYEALSALAGQVGATYAVEDLLPRLARILADGTGAERADVWLKAGHELRVEASWPPGTWPPDTWPPGTERSWRVAVKDGEEPTVDAVDRFTLVRHEGEVLGALSVSKRPGTSLTPAEDKLVSDLGAQAGLILRNVGLTEQLLVRLAELRASRLRIVAAQDDQRRRIERDIHDGAQQQLLGIAAKLELAESVAGRAEERERALIAQLKEDTRGALETLRELARGIYPPLLADQGLTAAVGAQVRKAAMPVELDAHGIGRYPEEIETAIYFCCVEALQNAGKHAKPPSVRVRLAGSDGEVSFAVQDDGPGFDRGSTHGSSGLQHMSDRLAALGGSLEIDTRTGSGTTVAGRIPLPG